MSGDIRIILFFVGIGVLIIGLIVWVAIASSRAGKRRIEQARADGVIKPGDIVMTGQFILQMSLGKSVMNEMGGALLGVSKEGKHFVMALNKKSITFLVEKEVWVVERNMVEKINIGRTVGRGQAFEIILKEEHGDPISAAARTVDKTQDINQVKNLLESFNKSELPEEFQFHNNISTKDDETDFEG
ncbi:MAG: hypothetical protein FWE45_04780 [Firmicutes bacterium]|nr:hypothetical protein [Bacillota bacterium]